VAHHGAFPGNKNRHFDVLSKECQEHRERLRGVIQGLADQVWRLPNPNPNPNPGGPGVAPTLLVGEHAFFSSLVFASARRLRS